MATFGAYHGSQARFREFDRSFARSGTKVEAYGGGVYLTDCPSNAAQYARRRRFNVDGRTILSDTFSERGDGTGNYHADCLLIRFGGPCEALEWLESVDREIPYGWENVDLANVAAVMRGLVGRLTVETVGYLYRVTVEAGSILDIDGDLPSFVAAEIDRLPPLLHARAAAFANPRAALVTGLFLSRERSGKPLEADLVARGYHGIRLFDRARNATEWTIFEPARVRVDSVEDLFPQTVRMAA